MKPTLEATAAIKYTFRSPFLFLLFFPDNSVSLEASEPTAVTSEDAKSIDDTECSPAGTFSYPSSASAESWIGSCEEFPVGDTRTGAPGLLSHLSDSCVLKLISAVSDPVFLRQHFKGLNARPSGRLRRLRECAALTQGWMLLLTTECGVATHSAIAPKRFNQSFATQRKEGNEVSNPNV